MRLDSRWLLLWLAVVFSGCGSGLCGCAGPGGVTRATDASEVQFCMIPAEGRKIVYLVDTSLSMDNLDFVRRAYLEPSIEQMTPQHAFSVVTFSIEAGRVMPPGKLVPGSTANKKQALQFVKTIVAKGHSNPDEGLRVAFSLKPEVLYLWTDGELFTKDTAALVKRLNERGDVVVHICTSVPADTDPVMRSITEANSGIFRCVTEEPWHWDK
jgi:von Willebrand factor type A domain